MIYLRRALTVAPGFLLLAFLILAIVSCQISATVLSAEFYKARLSGSDLYRTALTDMPLTVVGEIRRSDDRSPELDEILLMTPGLSDQEIVDSFNRVLPPASVQDIIEQALDEIVPYISGDRDGFTIRVDLKEGAESLVEEVKYLLRESDAYAYLPERVGNMVADEVVRETDELGLGVSAGRIAQAVTNTVTAEWLQVQLESSLDELAPYMLGETDDFEVRLQIHEIASRGADEAKDLLEEARAYDILYEYVLETAIADRLDVVGLTPSGVEVMEQEVLQVIRASVSPSWAQEQVEWLVNESADWISGASSEMSVVIDLRENKRAARTALIDLARSKAEEYLNDCPESLVALAEVLTTSGLRGCHALSDASRAEIGKAVSVLIEHLDQEIESHVLSSVPDSVHITHQDILWEADDVSEGHFASIVKEVRSIALRAQSFTEADLKEQLETLGGRSAVDIHAEIRSALSGGLIWTEQDLLSLIESEFGQQGLQEFQQARTWISRFQSFRWLAWLPVIFLLTSIGLLGGRNWPSRVSWAAACLTGVTELVFVAFRVLRSMWNGQIEDVRASALGQIDSASPFALSEELIIDKGFEIVADAGNVFIDGLVRQSLVGFAIGLALLAGVVGWRYWRTTQ